MKGDFRKTPEPDGHAHGSRGKPIFVVQKHAARRLHYDFRLEINGVLKSWDVPKGPSLDPGVKRLAVQVQDHLLEYADLEGGVPERDAVKAYEHGSLEFELKGERLHGRWALVRMGGRRNPNYWLLIKARDAEARPGSGDAVVTQN